MYLFLCFSFCSFFHVQVDLGKPIWVSTSDGSISHSLTALDVAPFAPVASLTIARLGEQLCPAGQKVCNRVHPFQSFSLSVWC